jgi:hypothetical protein
MKRFPLILLLVGGTAFAQAVTDYNLNDGNIRFSVPEGWSAIMEKSDGNPQAIIFHVVDPAAAGTDDTASVTVKTRQLKAAADFAEAMQNEMQLSKAQTGYEAALDGSSSGVHHYQVLRGKTRYDIRDRFSLIGTIAVQVRCQRPQLEATTRDWISRFDSGCDSIAASIK